MSKASLQLFGVVPDKGQNGSVVLIEEYATVVAPSAYYDLKNIQAWLKEQGVGAAERNSSFWKDWNTVRTMSDFRMRLEQVLHYMTTYGLEAWGFDPVNQGLVYVPRGFFQPNQETQLKVIWGIPRAELIERCFNLLNSGMALSQETIRDILSVLDECGYRITGDEVIRNREADVMFIQASGVLPKEGLKLFRYLVYDMTGNSMVINDKKTKEALASSGKRLPALDEPRRVALAQSFNRFKDLWMSIKVANKWNRPVVNQIAKLSKVHHKPMPEVVMNNVTGKSYEYKVLRAAAEKATTFQLVRAINAIRLRKSGPEGAVYRIRNSRIWTTLVPPKPSKDINGNLSILLDELRRRFADVRVYANDFVDYTFPTSEKSFVGNVPEGTLLRFKKSDEFLLVGVHWDNLGTDLDLRADSAHFSVGWNTSFRTTNRGLMHSGDMTRGIVGKGAAEWLYCQHLGAAYNLRLNLFHSGSGYDKKFKFMIGTSKVKPTRETTMAPEHVLLSTVMEIADRQIELGMIYDDQDYVYLNIASGNSGKGIVGRWTKYSDVQQNVARLRAETALRLSDVVPFVTKPEDATTNLSIETLTKDSFLNLLK